jgi:hypothetical protein
VVRVRRLCLLVVLGTLVGCGSGQSKQYREFVARADKLCPEVFRRSGEAQDTAAIGEVRALLRANDHLPLVRSWKAYAAARKRLRTLESALESFEGAARVQTEVSRREVFRRQVRIYEAERALPGIGRCTETPYTSA